MTATIQDVCTELNALGIRTAVGKPPCINVYLKDGTRVPDDTVWPPGGGRGWVWGDSFQWGEPADTDAKKVARRISGTLPKAAQ